MRVDGAGILLTQVCRSDQEIEDVSGAWKAAMIEKGWSPKTPIGACDV